MKFSVDRQKLCEAVSHFSRAVAVKSTIPALEGILLSAEGNKLTMYAYNLELGMTKTLDIKGYEDGDIIVNAKLFGDIIRSMPQDTIDISVDERLMCHIKSGSASFDIMGIASSEFPEMPSNNDGVQITLPSDVLKNMVRETIFAVAQNDAKPVHTGILFEAEPNLLRLVAVDGFRLAVRQEPIVNDKQLSFVVSGKAIGEAVKIIGEEVENINIKVGRRHVSFEISGYMLISRLLEGEFLKYQSIIPEQTTTKVKVNCSELANTVERISLIISDRIKTPVRCTINEEEMLLSCVSTLGKSQDSCPVAFEGEELNIGFNSRFLLDALRAVEADEIVMKFNGPLAPMIIEPVEGNEFLYMIMPMRIRNEN